MKTLVVTGGIGSGKSEVCRILSGMGVPVYDSDSRARSLYDTAPGLTEAVEDMFGVRLTLGDGSIDRKKLSSIVFSDPESLSRLEALVHPLLLDDFIRWREGQDAAFVVFESAIFYGKPLFHSIADKVVSVEAPLELRIRRVMERDAVDEKCVRARIAAQTSSGNVPDAVLTNDGTLPDLRKKTERLMNIIWK